MKDSGLQRIILSWWKSPDRKPLLRWGSWYFFVVSVLLGVMGLRYLVHYAWPKELIAWFYVFAAFTTHFAIMGWGLWLLLIFPLTLLAPVRKLIMPLSVVIASAILTLLLLDTLVFARNQFHINALTATILGWKTWGFGIVYLVILLAFNSMLAKLCWGRFTRPAKRLLGWHIGGVLLLLLLATHGLHIWADAQYYVPITRFTPCLPVFYPATAKGFVLKHKLVDMEQTRERRLVEGLKSGYQGALSYPLAPLKCSPPEKLMNVVLILADAMRSDIVTPEITPNIWKFAEDGIRFENHYSGGNSTRMGSFSVFYGLPCNYWKYMESIQRAPVIMDKFREHNYQVGVFSGSPLYRLASLDRTVFCNIPKLDNLRLDEYPRSYQRDAVITERWFPWLDSLEAGRPFFGFLFYDNPCPGSFPPDYPRVFESPAGASDEQRRFARYKTAAHYVDSLIGRVLDDLRRRGLRDDTIVIIAADHGEEFDDNGLGFSGHGSSYSEYQLKSAMVLHWPGKQPARVARRTSHNDLAATLLTDLFGCGNPPSDYCSGNNLFSGKQWDWFVAGSYHDLAIVEPDQVTINYVGGYFEVRDSKYRVISKPCLNQQVISEALNETRRFLKK